jgi:inosose dehydratase
MLGNFNTFGKDAPRKPGMAAETRQAFLDHIAKGHGLVIMHAGSSVFYDWPEFQNLACGTSMKIGCFALIQPFSPMRRQFELIRELGFDYADLTDNHDGATLGTEYGFSASFSLDSHPQTILDMVNEFGLTLTSVCAHANLLDPTSPDRYGTAEIIKAIKLAHFLGVKQVITTEGDPKTDFGHHLTDDQRLFSIREKLHEPIRWAETFGIELLLEPHGILTDTVDGMTRILDALGHEETVGINLDTGNSWLGGGDPLEFVKTFGPRIKHVHWKDMPENGCPSAAPSSAAAWA